MNPLTKSLHTTEVKSIKSRSAGKNTDRMYKVSSLFVSACPLPSAVKTSQPRSQIHTFVRYMASIILRLFVGLPLPLPPLPSTCSWMPTNRVVLPRARGIGKVGPVMHVRFNMYAVRDMCLDHLEMFIPELFPPHGKQRWRFLPLAMHEHYARRNMMAKWPRSPLT